MKLRLFILSLALALFVTMHPASAFAKDNGHGNDHQWNGDHDRNGGTPPGWSHGRKTGWRGGNEPPGQAKKHHDFDRGRDRDHHVRHASQRRHRTYRRPATTAAHTTTTRRWPANTNHTATAANTNVRRPVDYNDRH